MISKQGIAEVRSQFPKSLGTAFFACFVAAVFMVASAAYAVAHDHDDHGVDLEGECVVCSIAALGSAKLSPDDVSATTPRLVLVGLRLGEQFRITRRYTAAANPARAPPLSVSSH